MADGNIEPRHLDGYGNREGKELARLKRELTVSGHAGMVVS